MSAAGGLGVRSSANNFAKTQNRACCIRRNRMMSKLILTQWIRCSKLGTQRTTDAFERSRENAASPDSGSMFRRASCSHFRGGSL
jgi:hypothetical protein